MIGKNAMVAAAISGLFTLQLEGKLLAPWVGELLSMVDDRTQGLTRSLNLTDVDFVDTAP